MMKRFVFVVFGVAAFALSAAGEARACLCVVSPERATPEQARAALVKDFNGAFAVFSGEVVGGDTFTVKFKVDKIWKGQFGDEIEMPTGAQKHGDDTYSTNSCDYSFRRGEKYLVFAYGDSAAEMRAHSCTRTRAAAHAAQDIKDLDDVWPHERRNGKRRGEN